MAAIAEVAGSEGQEFVLVWVTTNGLNEVKGNHVYYCTRQIYDRRWLFVDINEGLEGRILATECLGLIQYCGNHH